MNPIIRRAQRFGAAVAAAFFFTGLLWAQAAADPTGAQGGKDRILLVLPFDNHSGQPSLDWVREAAPEILGARFTSAGFAPMSRADRLYALDHLGLPQGFQPSRASSLKLAQTLDADSIVVGSFTVEGTELTAEARILDVPRLRLSASISQRGEMRDLLAVFNALAWKLVRQLDPGFNVSEETFIRASAGLRLEAFEQFIRGITEQDNHERLRHLNEAVKLSPDYSEAWMALGREDYGSQQFEAAAMAFAKVGRNDPDALEAGFYQGISLLFSGEYARAEEAFAGVAKVLPLAQVVNNQGIAVNRRGQDGTALFRQAVAADPNDADYHFNLAVSLKRHGNTAEALSELGQCLKLRPYDSEAQALQRKWKEPSESGSKTDPLERIVRNFDAQAFRQAAQMMDQMDAARLAALSPAARAKALAGQAHAFLNRGLLLEAERLYLSAVAADSRLAEGHAGLAQVHERTGDAVAARQEARTSLAIAPSSDAYLVLARLDLAAGKLGDARNETGEALRLSPQDNAARQLRSQIEAREAQKP